MTDIPPEYKLNKEEIKAAFDSDFGEVHFDHKPTPEDILLIKLGLIADAAVAKAMPLIEKRAREEMKRDMPKIICLCGSSRFIETFAVLAWEFEKLGAITVGLHLLPASYETHAADHIAEAEGVAEKMDALHLKKIELADEIFVVNVNGYIGKSTAREIAYAEKIGKPVKYLEPLGQSLRESK